MSSGSSSTTTPRCAGCKHLRRKCPTDCVLAPYFPPSSPKRFSSVHEIFGASNVTKTLEQLPVHLRGYAAESMVYEATQRIRDPVYGCAGVITQLQQQIIQLQGEISKAEVEIARLAASGPQHPLPPLPNEHGGIQGEQSLASFSTRLDNEDNFIGGHQDWPRTSF